MTYRYQFDITGMQLGYAGGDNCFRSTPGCDGLYTGETEQNLLLKNFTNQQD